ncbi:MAG: InlB B-repeat-containing protein [Alistipes sp.]|jgi:hypothetical protein|nr:InlB B-repeat-containing protein [Alistipes sp.]
MKRILHTLIGIAALGTIASCSKDTYTVTFNSEGGTAIASQQIAGGQRAINPGSPTRGELVFLGWYSTPAVSTRSAGAEWNFKKDVVSSDTTLHARWQEGALLRLETLIQRAGTLRSVDYTDHSWNLFTDAMEAAKSVAADPDSDSDRIAEAVANLEAAIHSLSVPHIIIKI